MNKKVFYGEYTLMHWIELILHKDIVLPDYQRCFVWEDEQVRKFIKSLKDGNFIPPVIIGTYNDENIILDGQQRLTSVLLAYLGIFPKRDEFRITDDPNYVDGDEAAISAGGEAVGDAPEQAEADIEAIEWKFNLLIEQGGKNAKADILGRVDRAKYDNLPTDECLDDVFLNSNYLGFSYIVPTNESLDAQVRFYSTVFHEINMQGVALKAQESRRSLYYLDNNLVPFFEPAVSTQLRVSQNGKTVRYDFVRALAFASQYAKQNSEASIALRCKSQPKFEKYYENYINAVINNEDSDIYGHFSTQVGIANIADRTNRLQQYAEDLGYYEVFPSIIDADTYLIGLIYHILIKGEELDNTRHEEMKSALLSKIAEFKANETHRRAPNGVSNLRVRIRESIQIYQRFVL